MIMVLVENMLQFMQKLMRIEEIYESLPKIDCGSCGSPSCHSLAEDIVRGYASETDCVFKLREKISNLVDQMSESDKNHKIKSEE